MSFFSFRRKDIYVNKHLDDKRNINNEELHAYKLSHEPSSTMSSHDLSTTTVRLFFIYILNKI
jgi:hypothetical protein